MKLNVKHASDKLIAFSFIILLTFLGLSLGGNIILAKMAWYFYGTQQTIITPMFFDKPFVSSLKGANWSYFDMATMSFVYLRLNVTPETVDAQHSALLFYVPSDNRSALKKTLAIEAKYIKDNGVSSAFYTQSITPVPKTGDIIYKGVLKSATSNGPLEDQPKAYKFKMQYQNGKPELQEFSEIPYSSIK